MENFLTEREGVTGLGVIEDEPAMKQPPFNYVIRCWSLWIMMRHIILSIETSRTSTEIIGRSNKRHKLRRLPIGGLLLKVIRIEVRIGLEQANCLEGLRTQD
jgi:hypothetical protein